MLLTVTLKCINIESEPNLHTLRNRGWLLAAG